MLIAGSRTAAFVDLLTAALLTAVPLLYLQLVYLLLLYLRYSMLFYLLLFCLALLYGTNCVTALLADAHTLGSFSSEHAAVPLDERLPPRNLAGGFHFTYW